MKNLWFIFFVALLCLSFGPEHAVAQKKPVSIIGCYSDLVVIENEGLVVGNGSFRISKSKGRYVATYTELLGDGGEYAPTVRVQNLVVNKKDRAIKFDIVLDGFLVTGATGKISRSGIRMNWRKRGSMFGQSDPFLSRRYKECS